jgi:hypothetical protein
MFFQAHFRPGSGRRHKCPCGGPFDISAAASIKSNRGRCGSTEAIRKAEFVKKLSR